ncbi:MAG TPA: type IV-A pilus assembly ATPase PilB, partial [Moraxellaceae bacterium]|nr:type IV-A pilus assembly ATPase PilB [Moraxellaceae bacterium]
MSNGGITLSGLAKRLVEAGLLQEPAAQQAMLGAQKEQQPLIAYMLANKILKPSVAAMAVAQEFGDSLFDLDALDPESIPTANIDEKLIRKHNVLPMFRRGNRLFLAVSDPSRLDAIDAIRFNSGLNVETVVVEEDK